MTNQSFRQELEEIKSQERAEIQKILDDPNVSEEIKKIVRIENPDPSYHRPMLSIEQMMEVEDPELRDKNMPSPEQEFDQKEQRIGVEDVMATLTEREKKVIEMIFWEGKSQKEIAEETEIPLRTVNWIVNKSLKKLQQNPLVKELWDSTLYRTYPNGSRREQGAE